MVSAGGKGHELFSLYFSTAHVERSCRSEGLGIFIIFQRVSSSAWPRSQGVPGLRGHVHVHEETPRAREAGKLLQGQERSPALPQLQPIS